MLTAENFKFCPYCSQELKAGINNYKSEFFYYNCPCTKFIISYDIRDSSLIRSFSYSYIKYKNKNCIFYINFIDKEIRSSARISFEDMKNSDWSSIKDIEDTLELIDFYS